MKGGRGHGGCHGPARHSSLAKIQCQIGHDRTENGEGRGIQQGHPGWGERLHLGADGQLFGASIWPEGPLQGMSVFQWAEREDSVTGVSWARLAVSSGIDWSRYARCFFHTSPRLVAAGVL